MNCPDPMRSYNHYPLIEHERCFLIWNQTLVQSISLSQSKYSIYVSIFRLPGWQSKSCQTDIYSRFCCTVGNIEKLTQLVGGVCAVVESHHFLLRPTCPSETSCIFTLTWRVLDYGSPYKIGLSLSLVRAVQWLNPPCPYLSEEEKGAHQICNQQTKIPLEPNESQWIRIFKVLCLIISIFVIKADL